MKIKAVFLLFVLITWQSFIVADEPLKFAHEIYQVKPHPKAEFGALKNGFRYILLPNGTPDKRVLVYLFVNAGSLNELDNQQGLAHFLEHMAFNGTKNYPGESMIAFFKKIGMDFGGDTNAYTDFSETVYSLNLPEEKLMKEGIKIMSDYAMNMLLTPGEIEKERGVILSEKRERDDIEYRIQFQGFQFAMPGSLVANRFPIGLEDSIKTFKKDDFLDFYRTWYRPENMVLIVVGDIESSKWSKAISKEFGSFKSTAPKREPPVIAEIEHKGLKVNYYYEKEATNTNVEICTLVVKDLPEKTYIEKLKVEIAESAAANILNKRIAEILTQKDIPIISGLISTGVWLKKIHSGSFEVTCKPENWKSALILTENELRKALVFGFSDQEMMLFKKDYQSQLDNAVNTMATNESQNYVFQILNSLSENTPFMDAKQFRDMAHPIVEKLTKEEVLKEFQKYWQVGHSLISVSGNVEIKDAENEIKKVVEVAKEKEVVLQKEASLVAFPYEPKPVTPGKVLSRNEFEEHDFTRITFANNVVANIKKTDYKKNEVLFNVCLGTGGLSEPNDKKGLSHLAATAMNEGGLEKISKTDLIKTLAGKNVNVSFSVEPNCFKFQGETTPEDFELSLQVCRAMILNPGFREEANEIWNKNLGLTYNSLESNINAYFQNLIMDKSSNGNIFLFFPPRKTLEAYKISDVRDWLINQFKSCAIEINVTGDIDVKKTEEFLATYFGTLAERQKLTPKVKIDLALKQNFHITENFNTKIKKGLFFLMIPTVDFREIEEVRKLNLLGKILDEKTLKLIREKLSIAYSPNAGHSFDEDFKNYCHLQFFADIEPQNEAAVQEAFASIIKEVHDKGITSQDLEAVRKPTLNQIKDYINTNEYWLDRVLKDSVVEPDTLKYASTFLKSYEEITVAQINAVIKKYLVYENHSSILLTATEEAKKEKAEPAK